LLGPLKKAKGGFTHIFIAVDKFTKWIKVKHTASITMAKVVEFIKEICTCLAYPTILSQIMGLSSLRGSSRTFVPTQALRSTIPLCHTRRVTVKWNTLMA
jgi:hypothetical protein